MNQCDNCYHVFFDLDYARCGLKPDGDSYEPIRKTVYRGDIVCPEKEIIDETCPFENQCLECEYWDPFGVKVNDMDLEGVCAAQKNIFSHNINFEIWRGSVRCRIRKEKVGKKGVLILDANLKGQANENRNYNRV